MRAAERRPAAAHRVSFKGLAQTSRMIAAICGSALLARLGPDQVRGVVVSLRRLEGQESGEPLRGGGSRMLRPAKALGAAMVARALVDEADGLSCGLGAVRGSTAQGPGRTRRAKLGAGSDRVGEGWHGLEGCRVGGGECV